MKFSPQNNFGDMHLEPGEKKRVKCEKKWGKKSNGSDQKQLRRKIAWT